MEKFLENLEKAKNITFTADHLIYVTYPLLKDKKLLLKILLETKNAIIYSLNAILQYEYLFKRIKLNTDPKINFKTFQNKCAAKYEITDSEVNLIVEILDLSEKHKKSPMEYLKKDKIIILSKFSEQTIIPVEKIKEFVELSKKILKKIESKFLRNI
ncbi:hypothetical protein ISS08_02265 [Candidatus Pacearchaeota archaeon]|nr:hypothetical protein [Candidatus Pacearchaeota archaeon]